MIAVGDVAVSVQDAKAAARWWKEKVGFEQFTVGRPGGHAMMVAPPGDRFLLHLCEGFEPVSPGNTGIAFVTDDIDSHVRRMEAAGVTFTEPLRRGESGAHAKFADPDGNVFWLVEVPTQFILQVTERRAEGSPSSR